MIKQTYSNVTPTFKGRIKPVSKMLNKNILLELCCANYLDLEEHRQWSFVSLNCWHVYTLLLSPFLKFPLSPRPRYNSSSHYWATGDNMTIKDSVQVFSFLFFCSPSSINVISHQKQTASCYICHLRWHSVDSVVIWDNSYLNNVSI